MRCDSIATLNVRSHFGSSRRPMRASEDQSSTRGVMGSLPRVCFAAQVLVSVVAEAEDIDAYCLPDAVPLRDRRNLSTGQPLIAVTADWASIYVISEVYLILSEEKLGYNAVELRGLTTAGSVRHITGCDGVDEWSSCSPTDMPTGHVFLELWEDFSLESMYSALGDRGALNLGSIGYVGTDGIFLLSQTVSQALNEEGLTLEWYKSYNLSWNAPTRYFYPWLNIDESLFRSCATSQGGMHDIMQNFVRVVGDYDGVITDSEGKHIAKCRGGSVWLAPSCRQNPSTCILVITGGDGWKLEFVYQIAVRHDLPLAHATTVNYSTYETFVRNYPTITYWWGPDATFIDLNPIRLVLPAHDRYQWLRGDMRTSSADIKLMKLVWPALTEVAPDVVLFTTSVQVPPSAMDEMLLDLKRNRQDGMRRVACRWLRKHPSIWQRWIPSATACTSGQGIVDADGVHVADFEAAVGCDMCRPGSYSTPLNVPSVTETWTCTTCTVGHFAQLFGATACAPCAAGTSGPSPGLTICVTCAAGTYQEGVGQSACLACEVGKFRTELIRCNDCEKGRFGNRSGLTSCELCKSGTYVDVEGRSTCSFCGGGQDDSGLYGTFIKISFDSVEQWTYSQGATSDADCGCRRSFQLDSLGDCVACGVGLLCPGMNQVEILPGFATDGALSVYRCSSHALGCPGGRPGVCAEGRSNASIACAECLHAMTPQPDGTCSECAGTDIVPFIFGCILAPVVIILFYGVVARSAEQPDSNQTRMLLAVTLGQILTLLQQVAAVGLIEVQWTQPMPMLFDIARLFSFDINVLNTHCIVNLNAVEEFATRLAGIAVILFLFAIVHLVFVVFRRKNCYESFPRLVYVCGTALLAFHIATVNTVLSPFQCETHPNGEQTLRSYPGVLCWVGTSSDHRHMVHITGVAMMLPLGLLSASIWSAIVFPQRVNVGTTSFLRTWGFFFARFRSDIWWYAPVFLIRNTLISLALVHGTPLEQTLFMLVVMFASVALVARVVPWRTPPSNMLDIGFHFVMTILLAVALLFIDSTDLAFVSVLCFSLLIAGLLTSLLYLIYAFCRIFSRHEKHFRFFVCHHKDGAGCFARALKMSLERSKSRAHIFLDSDNLKDLDLLFDCVSNQTQTLVTLLSAELLWRPWCVGEITTAFLNDVRVVRVLYPNCERSSDAIVRSLDANEVDLTCLFERRLNLSSIEDAMRWYCEQSVLKLPSVMANDTMEQCSKWLFQSVVEKETEITSTSCPPAPDAASLIVVDHLNFEAAATAQILRMALPQAVRSQDLTTTLFPTVLDKGQLPPVEGMKEMLLLCSEGIFTQPDVLRALLVAAEEGATVLPVVTNSSFRSPRLHSCRASGKSIRSSRFATQTRFTSSSSGSSARSRLTSVPPTVRRGSSRQRP